MFVREIVWNVLSCVLSHVTWVKSPSPNTFLEKTLKFRTLSEFAYLDSLLLCLLLHRCKWGLYSRGCFWQPQKLSCFRWWSKNFLLSFLEAAWGWFLQVTKSDLSCQRPLLNSFKRGGRSKTNNNNKLKNVKVEAVRLLTNYWSTRCLGWGISYFKWQYLWNFLGKYIILSSNTYSYPSDTLLQTGIWFYVNFTT